MKKIFFSLVFGVALALTSCQDSSEEIAIEVGSEVTFSIAIDYALESRSQSEDAPSRYIVELYELAELVDAASGDPIQRVDDITDGQFTVALKDGTSYALLFWADYGSTEYDASDLKAVSIASMPTKEAFAGSSRFTFDMSSSDRSYSSITLTHAVAQVNFIQGEDFVAQGNSLKVGFSDSFTFSADSGDATSTGEAVEYSFTDIDQYVANQVIGCSYIFASANQQSVMELTTTFNGEVVKSISNVPFQRNCRTNITGAYSNLYSSAITVSCEASWGSESSVVIEKIFDYSKETSSNCYIVQMPGEKQTLIIPVGDRINTFWGADYANESTNQLSYGDSFTVSTLWYDCDSDPQLTYTTSFVDEQALVSVVLPATISDGNVLFAVKKNNVILWSWHLWITDYNPDSNIGAESSGLDQWAVTGGYVNRYSGTTWDSYYSGKYIMDRNIGARSSSYSDDEKGLLYYQFGRKDPFTYSGANIVTTSSGETLATAVNNPQTFYASSENWSSEATDIAYIWNDCNATGDSQKSIFDPSPLGWRVPIDGCWSSATVDNYFTSNQLTLTNSGAIYPAQGYLDSSGDITSYGLSSSLWSSTPYNTTTGYCFTFSQISVIPSDYGNRALGFAVRPVQE